MKNNFLLLLCLSLAASAATQELLFQGEELIFPTSQAHGQMFSAVLVTKDKKVIVFDGGRHKDNAHLISIIKQYSDTVDLWILTHAHGDHTDQLVEFINATPDALKVKQICYNFPPLDWIVKHEKESEAEATRIYNALEKTTIPKKIVKKGDVFELDGVHVEVINEPDLTILANPVNNASIVFNVAFAGKKLLITGDIGVQMGDKLVKECPDKLVSDIVVMSHHGQHGANKNFYAATKMSIAVWPTPQWLWDNNNGGGPGSGPWVTNYVKCWLQDLKVKRQYVTTKEVRLK